MSVFNIYILLILVSFGFSLIHFWIVSQRYASKFVPYFFNQKIIWDPNIDRLKLIFTAIILISPLVALKSIIEFNLNNEYFNFIGLSTIILLGILCLWFDVKKLNPLKNNSFKKQEDKNIPSENEISLKKNISQETTNKNYIINYFNTFQYNYSNINFFNKTELKSNIKNQTRGPKQFTKNIFIALKYYIIHYYDKEQRSNDFHITKKSFFERIATLENIDAGTLKSEYGKIEKDRNPDIFLRDRKYKKYILHLLQDTTIKKNKEIITLLEKFK
ncbi:hypothetical protein [Lutibacter citreus]|uniref:hypothetical protein n=1 Tax=Lutibacter citreus TaxID=2138210 RepID=UPI000DBE7A82|nr:hypothetical protein [Lutibacter citreus]